MSVLEISRMLCRTGTGDEMAERFDEAVANLLADPACLGVEIRREVENPDVFVQLIEWSSIEGHQTWRQGPRRDAYRAHVSDLLAQPNQHAHYEMILDRRAGTGDA